MDMRVPLGVGEILSDALAFLRRHFRMYALVALPFVAADLLLRETGSTLFARARALIGADPASVDVGALATATVTALAGIGATITSFLVIQLLGIAVITLTARGWARQPLVLGEALTHTAQRGPAIIATALLFFFVIVAATVPSLVLLAGVALFYTATQDKLLTALVAVVPFSLAGAAFIFVTLRLGLYATVVVLERKAAVSAFARSTELMAARGERLFAGPKWRLSVLLLVALLLGAALQALFALPRVVMASFIGWDVGDAGLPPLTALPLWFGVPFSLVEVATNSVVYPFTSILLTLFYFDLRVRYEALDLEPSA